MLCLVPCNDGRGAEVWWLEVWWLAATLLNGMGLWDVNGMGLWDAWDAGF